MPSEAHPNCIGCTTVIEEGSEPQEVARRAAIGAVAMIGVMGPKMVLAAMCKEHYALYEEAYTHFHLERYGVAPGWPR